MARVAVKHMAGGGFLFLLGAILIIVGGFWYPNTVRERVDRKLVTMLVMSSELDENFDSWKEVADFGGKVGNAGNPSHKLFYLFVMRGCRTLWSGVHIAERGSNL